MRKVIIIGATSGIGWELAKLYIQNGDMVGVTGRRGHLLDNLQQQFPSQVVTECFDVTGQENIKHLESLIRKLEGLDLLIYNSGYGEISETLDWAIDKQTTLINVVGFVEIVNYTFNYFVKMGRGQIAATSSIASIRENSLAPAYSASKAYLSVYMAGLHLKARKMKKKDHHIEVSISDILPGFVRTRMAKARPDDPRMNDSVGPAVGRGKGRFWEAPVEKAARQIFGAIQKKKRRTYITHRWVIIAWMLKWLPYSIFKRFG
jgi:short-subunit dehydrogenase